MITTQMNDWNRHLNGIPWTRKERPGVRSPKDGRPMQAARPSPAWPEAAGLGPVGRRSLRRYAIVPTPCR